jgi:hypothetical protein
VVDPDANAEGGDGVPVPPAELLKCRQKSNSDMFLVMFFDPNRTWLVTAPYIAVSSFARRFYDRFANVSPFLQSNCSIAMHVVFFSFPVNGCLVTNSIHSALILNSTESVWLPTTSRTYAVQ